MDREDRIAVAHLPAAVDDFLRTALHLGVAPLHRGEIEVGGVGAGGHRRSRATAQTDQHARSAELDQLRSGGKSLLEAMAAGDIADAAGDHDRLVVAAHLAVEGLLEGAEVAGQVGAAEFVVESGCAKRAFDHDVERRGDAVGLAVIRFPRLDVTGNFQVGNREAAETRLGLGTASGGTFITDFAARTGRRARKRRNGGRVVVRLDLGEDVRGVLDIGIAAIGLRMEALDTGAFDHGRVIGIGDHGSFGMRLVRLTDHAKQR